MQIKTDEILNPSTGGMKDDYTLLLPQIQDRAPFYVYRLLNGAKVFDGLDGDSVQVRSCGQEFVISKRAHRIFDRIKTRIQHEELLNRGITPPYNAEDVVRIFYAVQRLAPEECMIDPAKLRVYILKMDTGGVGFYRVMQPVRAIGKNCPSLHIEEGDWLSFPLGQKYDVIVAPRMGDPMLIGCLKNLKECGKLVVYECDDLLSNIPDWNPARDDYDNAKLYREYFIELCNGIITSTEQLKEKLGRHEVTHVCHNGINPEFWPMKVKEQPRDTVRILWGGSSTHKADLAMVVPAIKRLVGKFGKKIEFVFVNYAPEEFTASFNNNVTLRLGIHPAYKESIRLVPGCPVLEWSSLLRNLDCHMSIAPLVKHEFNECKSEVKVLEAWALGIPIIASDIAPYRRAVTHQKNGILCGDNPDIWYNEIKRLVESPIDRTRLAEDGLSELKSKYMIDTIAFDYEKALLSIARGKTMRPECNDAIERRLETLGV